MFGWACGTYLWHAHLDTDHVLNQSFRIWHIGTVERKRIDADDAAERERIFQLPDEAFALAYEKMRAKNSGAHERLQGAEGAVYRIWDLKASFWDHRGRPYGLFPPPNFSKELLSARIGVLAPINDAKSED